MLSGFSEKPEEHPLVLIVSIRQECAAEKDNLSLTLQILGSRRIHLRRDTASVRQLVVRSHKSPVRRTDAAPSD